MYVLTAIFCEYLEQRHKKVETKTRKEKRFGTTALSNEVT